MHQRNFKLINFENIYSTGDLHTYKIDKWVNENIDGGGEYNLNTRSREGKVKMINWREGTTLVTCSL